MISENNFWPGQNPGGLRHRNGETDRTAEFGCRKSNGFRTEQTVSKQTEATKFSFVTPSTAPEWPSLVAEHLGSGNVSLRVPRVHVKTATNNVSFEQVFVTQNDLGK